jgi:hypothetical protein
MARVGLLVMWARRQRRRWRSPNLILEKVRGAIVCGYPAGSPAGDRLAAAKNYRVRYDSQLTTGRERILGQSHVTTNRSAGYLPSDCNIRG